MDKINVGFIGCGVISNLHAPGYRNNKRASLFAVCDANPEIADPSQVVVGQKIVVPNKKDRGAVAATASPSSTAQRLAGYKTTPEIAETLRDLMGIQLEKGQTPTQQWQTVINAIPNAPLRAQQLLSSLQFDAKRGWYTASSRQIVNPAYI